MLTKHGSLLKAWMHFKSSLAKDWNQGGSQKRIKAGSRWHSDLLHKSEHILLHHITTPKKKISCQNRKFAKSDAFFVLQKQKPPDTDTTNFQVCRGSRESRPKGIFFTKITLPLVVPTARTGAVAVPPARDSGWVAGWGF